MNALRRLSERSVSPSECLLAHRLPFCLLFFVPVSLSLSLSVLMAGVRRGQLSSMSPTPRLDLPTSAMAVS
jgi:hypothetical protein